MADHIITMVGINLRLLSLDENQAWIDYERTALPSDQLHQLKLDRMQAQLNEERSALEATKVNIIASN